MRFILVMIAALIADQVTKAMILKNLAFGAAIPMGTFDITHVHNQGAAFGMLQNGGNLFVVIAVGVLTALLIALPQIQAAPTSVAIGLGLIGGGTIGNLIDRLRFGYVIDFIDFHWWPVFNVADSCICVGVGLLVIKIFQQGNQGVKPAPPAAEAKNDADF